MKFLTLFFCLTIFLFSAQAQTNVNVQDSTLTLYMGKPYIPSFKILLADSTWYSKTDLPKKKPVLILYFSPDCGHCQLETEDLISKMNQLKDLHIVMITSKPYEDMVVYADHFKLSRFSSIKIGSDPEKLVTRFYDVKFTPFSALYDKKGKLIKVYEKGIDWDVLTAML